MTIYFTGASNDLAREFAEDYPEDLGILLTPDTRESLTSHLPSYAAWSADNACFNHPEAFDLDAYLDWLRSVPDDERDRCAFATAPDVVGDPIQTWNRSAPVLPMIRAAGFPAALVFQDGIESTPIDWRAFDAVFLGDSTEWKLGDAARELTAEAKRRGKWVHMGRVNSQARFVLAHGWGCDSADGTFLAFGPAKNLDRLAGWFDAVRPLQGAPDVRDGHGRPLGFRRATLRGAAA